MSPEQVRGLPLDRRSDIFSLGTVFYESLTGAKLFQGESDFSTLERVRNVDVEPPRRVNANIPPEVEAIVMKALEGDVDKRYQWCSEMQADLQRFLMTQNPVFTAKTLSAWMKQHFQMELNRERQLMETYKKVGRDGKQVAAPARPSPSLPLAPPDLDLEDDLTGAEPIDDDSESTMMGGPDFGGILASKRQVGDTGDFGDDAPTEIFGEVDTNDVGPQGTDLSQGRPPEALPGAMDDDSASARTVLETSALEKLRQQMLDQPGSVLPAPAPHPGVPPAPQQGFAGMGAPGAPTMVPQVPGPPDMPAGFDMPQQPPYMQQQFGQGYYQPASGQQYAQPAGMGMEMFGATSTVAPLSASDTGPSSGKRRRRSSLVKDISIGVGIAVVVLGLFAGGKFFFKSESKAAESEPEPAKGTVAITVNGDEPADVFVDGRKMGTAQADKPLQLGLALGSHAIRVTRQDAKEPCERVVRVADVNVDQQVECTLESRGPPTGTLVLENLTGEHEVLVDGQKLADDKKTQPLELSADTAHQIVIKKGNDLVNSFTVTVAAGQQERRDITRTDAQKDVKQDEVKKDVVKKDAASTKPRPRDTTPAKETGPPGYLVIHTDPPNARVFVGRKDTQKTTPISPRNRIELPPGQHRIRLVLGGKKYHADVTIKSGEMTRLDKKLQ
jgi:hypothetical protein